MRKGEKMSAGQRRKIGLANKISLVGNVPWNKGKKNVYSPESISRFSLAKLGKPRLDLRGKKRTDAQRKHISEGRKGKTAKEKHPKWKGGVTSRNDLIRQSFEYKEWRRIVFRRDNWTCIWCKYRSRGKKNGRCDIEADHIKPFALFPELRFAIDNGRTLCVDCHKKVTFPNYDI